MDVDCQREWDGTDSHRRLRKSIFPRRTVDEILQNIMVSTKLRSRERAVWFSLPAALGHDSHRYFGLCPNCNRDKVPPLKFVISITFMLPKFHQRSCNRSKSVLRKMS